MKGVDCMATITIRVDAKTKQQAEELFNNLGLNLTSAINIYLKKAIAEQGVPFEVKKTNYNQETIQAMLESERLAHDPNTKKYNSFSEILEEIDQEDET